MSIVTGIAIERELLRLGVNAKAMGGFAGPAGISADDLLAWLRKQPRGLGRTALLKRMSTQGPRSGEAASGMPPRDPTFLTPELDAKEHLFQQLTRLLPSERYPGGWAINGPFDAAAAAEALAALPDDAAFEAIRVFLPISRCTPGSLEDVPEAFRPRGV